MPEPKVLNAKDFGLPQNRERIFIIGFKKKGAFKYPKPNKNKGQLVKSNYQTHRKPNNNLQQSQ